MARRDLTGAVDFTVLEHYAGGDVDVMDEVLGLFQQQSASWGGLLDAAGEGWRDAAHTLRGSAAGIGAQGLAECCLLAEQAGDAQAGPALERVKDALALTLADVAAFRHELMLRSLRG
ncbi:Hpt domain-containing protein [Brevundimonas sp. 2R-24]|uniref:Hpt domain-containing protein n=1 Tax=Peiella sedimenti TaxID=3061083 RepID=A0ABT8SL13_9CAUL|nr:Hpt domain-containing protein [Caulobacteraceae bacterium XZ-24]